MVGGAPSAPPVAPAALAESVILEVSVCSSGGVAVGVAAVCLQRRRRRSVFSNKVLIYSGEVYFRSIYQRK